MGWPTRMSPWLSSMLNEVFRAVSVEVLA